MASPRIREFTADDVEEAGRLLAGRHRAHRLAEPLLSEEFEDPGAATREVAGLLADGVGGAVAEVGGRMSGFLLAVAKSAGTWGDNAWVESAGHAVEDAETVRDLYAAAAARWAEEGHDSHYVLVPSHEADLVDAWFRLGFGQQHVHAVREVLATSPVLPPGVTVRRAQRADIPVLGQLDLELPRHQAQSPVFAGGTVPTLEEAVADWEESFDDEGFAYFVAEHSGRVVGAAVGCPLERSSTHSALMRPHRAGFLGFAAVLPEARGLGAGRALGEAVLSWTAQEGFGCAATDWRATNLLSSRTWPRLGFRPTFLRLHRRLGH